MELLLSRPLVVAWRLLGALLSTAASSSRRGATSARRPARPELVGYGAMGASMLLSWLSGLRGA